MAELVFGKLVGGHHIDAAIESLLKKWLDTYLHEVARQSGEPFEVLSPVRSYRVSTDMEKMPEDQTPCVIITSSNLLESPEQAGASKMSLTPHRSGYPYSARWEYQIGVHVSAKGKKKDAVPRAVRRAKMYCLAVRAAMVQQRDDDEVLGMIDWLNEEYGGIESTSDRTTCLAYNTFGVEAHDVTSWGTGPLGPEEVYPPLPQEPLWPEVVTTDADVVKVPQEEDFTWEEN